MDRVLAQLDPSLAQARLTELGEGWDNVTWAVEGMTGAPLILRVSKLTDPTERADVARKDGALLDFSGRHTAIATNRVVAMDPGVGALLLTRVPGVPVAELLATGAWVLPDPAAAGRALGSCLSDLHGAAVPAGLVEEESLAGRWHTETTAAFAAVADRVARADRDLIEAFLARPVPGQPARVCFCHNDLGEEHVLVEPASGEITGIIDFSDARLGDPAVDFALLWFDLGVEVVRAALGSYRGVVDEDLVERARWFGVRAGVAGVAHRLAIGDPRVDRVLARVRAVLGEWP